MSKSTAVALPPAFVNLQPGPTMVPGPDHRTVTVSPWEDRNRLTSGTFVVYGEHYARYVSGAGPLYPFPGDRAVLERPGCAQGRGVVIGESSPDVQALRSPPMGLPRDAEGMASWYAQVREQLRGLGIANAVALSQAPSPALRQAAAITDDAMVKFVREHAREIFSSTTIAPEADGEAVGAGEGEAVGAGEGEAVGAGAKSPRVYKRSEIEAMTRAQLVAVVEAEAFEIDTKKANRGAILAELLAGLADYHQLDEA